MTERADLAKAWDHGYRHGRDTYAHRHTAAEGARANPYLQAEDPERCPDLTRSPRGWLQCTLPAGHDTDPRSLHTVDPAGPVAKPRSSGILRGRTHGGGGPDAA